MNLVSETVFSYSNFLAQQQQEFLQLPQKLIIEVFNLISDFKSPKPHHSKDNNINSHRYINSTNLHISIN
jgi:hypothetical protein